MRDMEMNTEQQKNKPLFIMVEGVDGSGKSTICEMLRDEIAWRGMKCEYVSAFGSGELGSLLRKAWLSSLKKPECSRITEFNMFMTAVMDAMSVATKHLEEGKCVIMDRGYISTYVYQLLLNTEDIEHQQLTTAKRIMLTTVRHLMLKPDITLYCQTPLETVRENIAKRGILNHMDKIDSETLMKCFEIALEVFRMEGNKITIIDNSGPYPKDHSQFINKLIGETK